MAAGIPQDFWTVGVNESEQYLLDHINDDLSEFFPTTCRRSQAVDITGSVIDASGDIAVSDTDSDPADVEYDNSGCTLQSHVIQSMICNFLSTDHSDEENSHESATPFVERDTDKCSDTCHHAELIAEIYLKKQSCQLNKEYFVLSFALDSQIDLKFTCNKMFS